MNSKLINVKCRRIYETSEKSNNQWILIIYSISANHYVGVPVYSEKSEGYLYLKSINKYVDLNMISDYNRIKINRCIFLNGKVVEISEYDYNKLLKESKKSLIAFLSKNIRMSIDDIKYIKWCRDKYIINGKNNSEDKIIQNGIYWVDFGFGVGSEIRKLRPAILWKSTKDKKMWTMIPLTTKRRSDTYYFHYDLECLAEGTAKIENMMNFSSKRILTPYFAKNKLAILTDNDYKNINEAIIKYYAFK